MQSEFPTEMKQECGTHTCLTSCYKTDALISLSQILNTDQWWDKILFISRNIVLIKCLTLVLDRHNQGDLP
jgi:hypothetical protein